MSYVFYFRCPHCNKQQKLDYGESTHADTMDKWNTSGADCPGCNNQIYCDTCKHFASGHFCNTHPNDCRGCHVYYATQSCTALVIGNDTFTNVSGMIILTNKVPGSAVTLSGPQGPAYNPPTITSTSGGIPIIWYTTYEPEQSDKLIKSTAKCECGSKAIGIKDFEPGHSDWCSVSPKKKLDQIFG